MSGIVGNNTNRSSGLVKAAVVGADSITGSEIADDSIDSEHYVDGSIDNAHIADNAIDSEHYAAASIDNEHLADNAVNTAEIANNAVDETKLKDALVADFTEVVVTASDSILLGDATDSGNTKRDTVQGIIDLAGGGWKLIGTQTASDDATITQTGLGSTYDSYVCVFSDVVPATDGANFRCRVGNSGGLISTTNTYSAIVKRQADNSATPLTGAASRNATDFILLTQNVGSASGEGASGVIWIWGNQGGSMKPHINWKATNLDDNGHCYDCSGAANHDNAITMDRFGFHFASGNITSGRFTFYGVAHA